MTLGLFFPTQPLFSGRGLKRWIKRAIETPAVEMINVQTGEVIDRPLGIETVKPAKRVTIDVCGRESSQHWPEEFTADVRLACGDLIRGTFKQFGPQCYRMIETA